MKDSSVLSHFISKLQLRTAEAILLLGGPCIVALVCVQIWRGHSNTKSGGLMLNEDPFSLYLLNGIIGGIGICALAISMATARHVIRSLRGESATRSTTAKINLR